MSMNECPASVQPDKHGFGAQREAPPKEHEKELLLQEMPMNHQARMPLLREPVSSSDSATFSSLGATQADYHHTPQERKNANSRGPLIHQDFRQGTGTARLPPCSQPYEPRTEKNDFSLSSGKLGHMT
ncbi:hypothetical protein BaRGS_00038071 [Batillaria attramentaria]|uniref:Prolactin receptor n=1 Tax=Batillaria attramentaria TaxID=370345 RepID=A0ABD0J750_9CAEN